MNRIRIALLVMISLSGVQIALAQPQEQLLYPAGYLDEAEFRDALRLRGLDALLDRYLAEVPPADAIDDALRRREDLLQQAARIDRSSSSYRSAIQQATHILRELLDEHPHYPAAMNWRYQLARDLLERTAPAAFDRVLLNGLPGRDRQTVGELAGQAIAELEQLRDALASAWKQLGQLDERTLHQQAGTTAARWQELDQSSALLLAWARLYHALARANATDQAPWAELLDEIIHKQRWHDLGPGQEPRKATALLMAAVSARQLGQFDTADGYARQVIATINQLKDSAQRRQLDKLALAAVLEQICTLRDADKFEDALKSVEQARQWLAKSRPQDYPAAVALALIEHSVLARSLVAIAETSATTQPATDSLLAIPAALAPLQRLAAQSPEHRDALYMALAPVVSDPNSADPSPFVLQLLLGASVAEAIAADRDTGAGEAIQPAVRNIDELLDAARQIVEQADGGTVAVNMRAELAYLAGRVLVIQGQYLEAARMLTDLAEHHPESDRAASAALIAVNLCQQQLRLPESADTAAFCTTFAHAGRLLRTLLPDRKENGALGYYIALALEQVGERAAALEEYRQVPTDDDNALRAALGQVRVVRAMVSNAIGGTSTAPATGSPKLAEMLEITDQAVRQALDSSEPDRACVAAEIVVHRLALLNHAAIGQPEQALELLERWHNVDVCPQMLPGLLEQRIAALTQLQRMAEARLVAEQLFEADPQSAGTSIGQLMQTLTVAIDAADDSGEMARMRELAGEGAATAELMEHWYQRTQAANSNSAVIACRLWRARCLVAADRAERAWIIYEDAAATQLADDSPLRTELQLGRAECLLALARAVEALPLFARIWQAAPEHSVLWWRAFVGSLRAHLAANSDPRQIVQSIRQQKQLDPNLGAPRFKRALEQLEQSSLARTATQPAEPK